MCVPFKLWVICTVLVTYVPTFPLVLATEGPSEPSMLLKLPTSIIAYDMPPMPTFHGNTLTYQPCCIHETTNVIVSHLCIKGDLTM